jgi:hypothetical protein
VYHQWAAEVKSGRRPYWVVLSPQEEGSTGSAAGALRVHKNVENSSATY